MFKSSCFKRGHSREISSQEKLQRRVYETPPNESPDDTFKSIGALGLEYNVDTELEQQFKIRVKDNKGDQKNAKLGPGRMGFRSRAGERPKSARIEHLGKRLSEGFFIEKRSSFQLILPSPLLDYTVSSYNSVILT